MVDVYIGSSPFSFGVSFSALGVSEGACSCFRGWLVEGGGMSLAGVAAGGDAGSSGSADRMCCRELMLATGPPLGQVFGGG